MAVRLEREAMAWPPAVWERDPGAWRDDVWPGTDPFLPYLPPVPAAGPPIAEGKSGVATLAREILETVILTAVFFVGIRLMVHSIIGPSRCRASYPTRRSN